MSGNDWKASPLNKGVRHHVVSHVGYCLELLNAEKFEEAKYYLHREAWRTGLDLTGVPETVIDRTDNLCSRASGLLAFGHPEAIKEVVLQIKDLWA